MAAQRIPVLMYHRVGTTHHAGEQTYCVAPERFAGHMKALARNGYRAVAIADFMTWLDGRRNLPEGSFVLTFDDGFLGVHDHAAPVLTELGWPATVFLVSALIGRQDEWLHHDSPNAATHPLLDAAHIAALAKQGFSFHSHSRHHADLTRLGDAELEDEVAGSRTELAGLLGEAPDFLAYPYGRFDDRVVDCARRAGYRAAFSVLSGFNRQGSDPFRIRRLDVFGTDTPAMLLRKIRLGSNDGSWQAGLKYAAGRFRQRFGGVA
jgi:peptidoglycan/xylan/chitin deacetylase (PgdA/CDA1 family)